MQKSPSCSPPKERSHTRKRRRSHSSRSRRSRRSHRHSSRRHSSRSPRRRRSRRHRRSRRRSPSLSFDSNQTPTQVAGLQEIIAQAVQAAVAATAASISNLPTSQNANVNVPVTKQAKQLLRGTIPAIKFVRVKSRCLHLHLASSANLYMFSQISLSHPKFQIRYAARHQHDNRKALCM